MSTWPGTLPQEFLQRGASETAPNLIIRTNMDAGPAKVRRRFTAEVRPIQGNLLLTTAQVATLDTFFVTTVKGGSLAFDWVNQRTAASESFRFVGIPTYTKMSGDFYEVTLKLEQLP